MQNTSEEPPVEGQAANRYWEIKLAWSEYKHGKWSPKTTVKKSIKKVKMGDGDQPTSPETWSTLDVSPQLPDKSNYTFVPLDLTFTPPNYQDNNFAIPEFWQRFSEKLTILCFEKPITPIEEATPFIAPNNHVGSYKEPEEDTSVGWFSFSRSKITEK